ERHHSDLPVLRPWQDNKGRKDRFPRNALLINKPLLFDFTPPVQFPAGSRPISQCSNERLMKDTNLQRPFASRFCSAPDGLKLYLREYGSIHDPGIPAVCLAGLTRNSAD